jgi:hypothetical protein
MLLRRKEHRTFNTIIHPPDMNVSNPHYDNLIPSSSRGQNIYGNSTDGIIHYTGRIRVCCLTFQARQSLASDLASKHCTFVSAEKVSDSCVFKSLSLFGCF